MNQSVCILIIEDELVIAENLKENLIELGYNDISIVSNFIEAKKISKTIKPDLFLVDVGLNNSEKDGIEIMKDLFSNVSKPIIYLTSYTDKETRERAKITKPSAYLEKGVSKKQLEIAIDFALTNFNKSEERSEANIDHNCPFVTGPGYFFIKGKEIYEKVIKNDIISMQADGTYTDIITNNKVHKYYLGLNKILDLINHPDIVRCHRSYAVNVKMINGFDDDVLYLTCGKEILSVPLGGDFRKSVMAKLPRL